MLNEILFVDAQHMLHEAKSTEFLNSIFYEISNCTDM
jgi:hypothetical protein